MKSFDQSLKYLLSREPEVFVHFGLQGAPAKVLKPVANSLPSRGRDIDGSYIFICRGAKRVAHIEFHRRHQKEDDLAIDIAEAQVRLYRREKLKVTSFVWDLYGHPDEPVFSRRALAFGERSTSYYRRINLRGMGFRELLEKGPPGLWPLTPLTRDGASEEAVRETRDAVEARVDLSGSERADHLAVLWFMAEAEDVAMRLLYMYIHLERLMESKLYRDIFTKGQQEGLQQGLQQAVLDLCELLGIKLTRQRKAQLKQLDLEQLSALRMHLKTHRAWLSGT